MSALRTEFPRCSIALRALRYAVPAARKPWVAIPWLPVRRMRRTRVRGVQFGRPAELVAKIVELQRHVEFRLAQERDGVLKVVAFLARDANLSPLDLRLHLELRILEQARHLFSGVGIDSMPEHHVLLGPRQVHHGILDLEACDIDAALGNP